MMSEVALSFVLNGVPPNWSNRTQHWAKLYRQREIWHRATLIAAREAIRRNPDFPYAEPGSRRFVKIVMYRHGLLDPDAVTGAVKPIVDRLQAQYEVYIPGPPRKKVWVDGPGLIWRD